MLTVYALRWTMQTGEKYKPYREQWALSLSEASRHALTDFVREEEHSWPCTPQPSASMTGMNGLKSLSQVGLGYFESPPFGPVETIKEPLEHPITKRVESFHLEDEVYNRMQLTLDVEPLLSARATEQEIANQFSGLASLVRAALSLMPSGMMQQPYDRKLTA